MECEEQEQDPESLIITIPAEVINAYNPCSETFSDSDVSLKSSLEDIEEMIARHYKNELGVNVKNR